MRYGTISNQSNLSGGCKLPKAFLAAHKLLDSLILDSQSTSNIKKHLDNHKVCIYLALLPLVYPTDSITSPLLCCYWSVQCHDLCKVCTLYCIISTMGQTQSIDWHILYTCRCIIPTSMHA